MPLCHNGLLYIIIAFYIRPQYMLYINMNIVHSARKTIPSVCDEVMNEQKAIHKFITYCGAVGFICIKYTFYILGAYIGSITET